MKNLILIFIAISSFSILANEIECAPVSLLGSEQTGKFNIGFKLYDTGKKTQESGLHVGDHFITDVDMSYVAEGVLTNADRYRTTNRSLTVLSYTQEQGFDENVLQLEVELLIPQDISYLYNQSQNKIKVTCQEFITCPDLDC